VITRQVKGGFRQVEAHVPVLLHVRREQAAPAGQVDEHRTRSRGGRDASGAGSRDPVQHREAPTGCPPLVDQLVVLPGVVARQDPRVLLRGRTWQGPHVPTLSWLVRACHPEPTAAVTLLAATLVGASGGNPVIAGAAVLSGQLSVGWSNDWVDAERDRAVGRQDKPVVQGLPVRTLRRAALVALLACVPLSLLMGRYAGAAHLIAVASAWLYNARLKATVLSFVPYALSFGLMPAVVTLTQPGHPSPPWWATAAGALIGVGAHGANVLPDMDDDRRTGVNGLPQRLGRRTTSVLAGVTLLAATALLAAGPGSSVLGWSAVAVATAVFAVGLLLGRRPGSRAPFLAVLLVAAVDVGLLLLRGGSLAS
jgi:4-hydroxybenzoate polyprenyltransferase